MKNNIKTKNSVQTSNCTPKAHPPEYYINNNVCPICGKKYAPSEYLAKVFKDNPKALFIADLVTHYRHHHIESWNRCWGYSGRYYRRGWFKNYDAEKRKYNERAKRQIIRKAAPILIALGITSETFKCLQHTDRATLELAKKKLDNKVITNSKTTKS